MKVYATDESLTIKCPACSAPAGVACGYSGGLGPTAHERRIRAVTPPPPPVVRTSGSPATRKQVDYVRGLASTLGNLTPEIAARIRGSLTHADCVELIPILQEAKKHDDGDDGYDGSLISMGPDMDIHRYDGGGAFF